MDDREGGKRGSGRSVLLVRHDDDNNIYIYIYILVFYIYFIAWMLICDHRCHAVLLRQSSGRERKLLEKSKKSKNTVKRMFTLRLCITLCVCVCVCVCVYVLFVGNILY